MAFDLPKIVSLYLMHYPDEAQRQHSLSEYIPQHSTDWHDRKNMSGHLTASGIVIDKARNLMLAIRHVALDRWLQPGGHVESTDESLRAAALREVAEETGIPLRDLAIIGIDSNSEVPLDIDTHKITARLDKGEAEHVHFDFRYLMEYTGDGHLTLNKSEVAEADWRELSFLSDIETFRPLIKKVRHLLSSEFRIKKFYDAVSDKARLTAPKARSIVISHIIPDCIYYLRAVNHLWPIDFVIPKPNSISKEVREKVEAEFVVRDASRADLSQVDNSVVDVIRESGSNETFILFDIGGYFVNNSIWPEDVLRKVILIVEDTENGHQKYLKSTSRLPVVSVARSPLKENEDFLVGQSILFSADALLRVGGILIQYLKCGVLGYGKIGRSIAFHLLQRGVKPMVFDIDAIRRLEAHNRLCAIPSRDHIIETCDAIFCATGNRCLDIKDFRRLKSGCLIFSVTSSDDEFDVAKLGDEYERESIQKNIIKYSNFRNFFFLVNDGNAVNFLHNAVMGPFIHLVRAEMILAASTAESRMPQEISSEELNTVSDTRRREIAEIWIRIFDPEDRKFSSMEYIK